jgi:hypothetical protein
MDLKLPVSKLQLPGVPLGSGFLHIPGVESVADADDEQQVCVPATPRLDDKCFESRPSDALIEECLCPGGCAIDGPERVWMGGLLHRLGHAANDRGHILLAHSWFQCAYAAKGSATELLSALNMRLKLGQWHLCERLYACVKARELTAEQMSMAERKHEEVGALLAARADRPERLDKLEELDELLAAPKSNAGCLTVDEMARLVGHLRVCGHAANRDGDCSASHVRPFARAHLESICPIPKLSTPLA